MRTINKVRRTGGASDKARFVDEAPESDTTVDPLDQYAGDGTKALAIAGADDDV